MLIASQEHQLFKNTSSLSSLSLIRARCVLIIKQIQTTAAEDALNRSRRNRSREYFLKQWLHRLELLCIANCLPQLLIIST